MSCSDETAGGRQSPILPYHTFNLFGQNDVFEQDEAVEWREVEVGPGLMVHLDESKVQLWPAARLLALWLHRNEQLYAGKRVVELGCGYALPSMVRELHVCPPVKSVHR